MKDTDAFREKGIGRSPIAICKDRIRRAEESRGRTCGTATARKFWYDLIEESIRLYDRIRKQMETTREMEEYIKGIS